MAGLQQTSSLNCPVCGRHTSASDADLRGAAAPASCPSCGSVTARASSVEDVADAAATQRMAAPDIVEESTAILAPPPDAVPPDASTQSETLERILGAAPRDQDRYQTTSATQPVIAAATSGPAEDQPTSEPEAAAALPEGSGSIPQRDDWRNPWLIGSVILVLLILFLGGILLSQSPGHALSPVSQVTPAPAATSTATATLTAGYTRVEDASRLYSFAVPSSWMPVKQPSANAEFTIYTDPSHSVTFEVESFPASNGQTGAALDNLVLAGSFPAHSVSNISGPVTTSLADVTWIKETASLALQQNGTTEQKNLAVQTTTFNGTTFIIFYNSPVAANTDAGAQALPSILESFAFLG